MATRKKWDVVVLGGINSDFLIRGDSLPEPGETVLGAEFFAGPGGKGANQAVAATRLGARVAFLGAVGRDRRGRELAKSLKASGVACVRLFQTARADSGAALILVRRDGEKQIIAAPGANAHFSVAQLRKVRTILLSARVLLLQLELPLATVMAAAKWASAAGIKVVLDPAPPKKLPRQMFQHIHYIRPNAAEALALTGIKITDIASARRAAKRLLSGSVEGAVVQAGERGDLVVGPNGSALVPRWKVKSVDATGAGDAFAAGLAVGLAEGQSLLEAACLAGAAAALATTKIGAQTGLPFRKEVDHLRKRRQQQFVIP